ncbi:hypothetical protein D3C83_186670 [compost metagenome]
MKSDGKACWKRALGLTSGVRGLPVASKLMHFQVPAPSTLAVKSTGAPSRPCK